MPCISETVFLASSLLRSASRACSLCRYLPPSRSVVCYPDTPLTTCGACIASRRPIERTRSECRSPRNRKYARLAPLPRRPILLRQLRHSSDAEHISSDAVPAAIARLVGFVENPHPRQKHTCDQYAKRDVVESVRENVHDNRPIARRLAHEIAISWWTFPRSVKGPR